MIINMGISRIIVYNSRMLRISEAIKHRELKGNISP